MKKIVIAGGTGFLGRCLIDYYAGTGTQLVVLTRGASAFINNVSYVTWNGKTLGSWASVLEHADVLINLNGKSVDCRYTEKNKALIYATRLESTNVLGQAVQNAAHPPLVWINAASATIYRHALDKDMDEYTGEVGTGFSVDVCNQWEKTFNSFEVKQTRKILIRTSIVLGKKSGALIPLKKLATIGFGGKQGGGNQYVSWLHENDFVRIIDFLIQNPSAAGVYNVTAPTPVPNSDMMRALRSAVGMPIGLPLPKLLLEVGAMLIGTETELILKSRRVVPKRLLQSGYTFQFDTIEKAINDLCS